MSRFSLSMMDIVLGSLLMAALVGVGWGVVASRRLRAAHRDLAVAAERESRLRSDVSALQSALQDQAQAVEALKAQGIAAADRVRLAAAAGSRTRTEAEALALRIGLLPPPPDPAAALERSSSLGAVMGAEWNAGR